MHSKPNALYEADDSMGRDQMTGRHICVMLTESCVKEEIGFR
jgi:hypothetical protein